MTTARFGVALKRYINSDDAYALLDDTPELAGSTWQAGGCWALAQALRELIRGSHLCAVVDMGGVQHHVLVRLGEHYLDADGASTEAQLLRRWRTLEHLQGPSVQSFVPRLSVGEIACPPDLVKTLRRRLAARLPWGELQVD